MLKSCQYCGRIHPVGYLCPARPKRKKTAVREADVFRSGYSWQKKRDKIKKRDHYFCRICLSQGEMTYSDLEVHHIQSLEERPELALEDDNLITLCGYHHERAEHDGIPKGELERLARTPLPLDVE